MAQRPDRHGRSRLKLDVWLPQVGVRRVATGAQPPAPGSRIGGTGTPRHSIRCPDDLWGAAIQRLHAADLELATVLRGYLGAIVRGEAPIFPDPTVDAPEGEAPA